MKTVIYSTDTNLMYNSYKLIGVCDNKEKAINLLMPALKKYAKENWKGDGYNNKEQQLKDLVYSLESISQTQSMDENFVLEQIALNKLID